MEYIDLLASERLDIRRFMPEDAANLCEYTRWRMATGFDLWEKWPTDIEGCKGVCGYFAGQNNFWAVARKAEGKLIGFVSFNAVGPDGRLDMGHGFVPACVESGEAQEALARMIDYAMTLPGVTAVEARSPEEWAEQLAPLLALGFGPCETWRIMRRACWTGGR